MKKSLLFCLLSLCTLACGEAPPDPDPRCLDICEDAQGPCGSEARNECEASCAASIEGFSAAYAACVLERAYVGDGEREDGLACDFVIDDREACTSQE